MVNLALIMQDVMSNERDEHGLETTRSGTTLQVIVDKKLLADHATSEKLLELITTKLDIDGVKSIVILPRKDTE